MVMTKQYSDSISLKYPKKYTRWDTLEEIKKYHLGEELDTAFKLLHDNYGKA